MCVLVTIDSVDLKASKFSSGTTIHFRDWKVQTYYFVKGLSGYLGLVWKDYNNIR